MKNVQRNNQLTFKTNGKYSKTNSQQTVKTTI